MHTKFLACLAGRFMVLAALAVSLSAFAAATDPAELVRKAAGDILAILNENRDKLTSDPKQLHDMVRRELLPLIDHDHSARLILGKHGRSASPEQLKAFSDAMSDVLIDRYADGLLEFRSNEQLEVLPTRGENSEKLTRVRTRVKLESGGYAPVDYAFRMTEDGWKAFDVTVEGISYVITFRNQIAPRIDAEGIDKVTADIRSGTLKLNE